MDTAGCKNHGIKREIMCKECKQFFCPKCVVSHLQQSHNVNLLEHADNAIEIIKGQIQGRIKRFHDAKMLLHAEKAKLMRKTNFLKDNSELDNLYRETIEKMGKVIVDAKKSKGEVLQSFLKLGKQVEKLELKCEIDETKESQLLKKISEGKNEEIVFKCIDNNDAIGSMNEKLQALVSEVKNACKNEYKVDCSLIDMSEFKKEVQEKMYKSIKMIMQLQDDNKLVENVKEKAKKLLEYKQQIKEVNERIAVLKSEGEIIEKRQKETKTKLEEIKRAIEEDSKRKEEANVKKVVKALSLSDYAWYNGSNALEYKAIQGHSTFITKNKMPQYFKATIKVHILKAKCWHLQIGVKQENIPGFYVDSDKSYLGGKIDEWAFHDCGYKVHNSGSGHEFEYGTAIKEGSVVIVIYDSNKNLSFEIDGSKYGAAYNNINGPFYLAVGIGPGETKKIELINVESLT